MNAYEQVGLNISEEVQHLLENRHILIEDLQKVIHHAETTGEKFIDPSSGRSLAFLRPARVTFWVEYSPAGDGFQIHSAYVHRMEKKRGGLHND